MANVVLAGMMGRMGTMITLDLIHSNRGNLVGAVVAPEEVEHAKIFLKQHGANDVVVASDAALVLDTTRKADVYLDFSIMDVVEQNANMAVSRKIPVIIGVSGFIEEDYDWMRSLSMKHDVPILLVPNFSLGIILVKKMVEMARRFYPKVELIEAHHDQKRDAPSATSLDIATLLAKIDPAPPITPPVDELDMGGARGMELRDVHIHAIRLPGIIAEQNIIFGSVGEQLSITHRTTSRESFLRGIYYAIDHVSELKGFQVGLESVLEV